MAAAEGPSRHLAHRQPIEVISVGDVATDVFIRLLEARLERRPDRAWLSLPFGAKVPFEHAETVRAGGNAANAAVAFSRLGLVTALVANVGGDAIGRDVFGALAEEGVDTRFIRVDPSTPTNRNFVLWYGEDRTILVHHERYEYHWPHLRPSEIPAWVYLTSVGEGSDEFHEELAEWLEQEPAVRFAFQPGTFQIAAGAARLRRLYARADVLLCNREEAARIGGVDGEPPALLARLHELGAGTVIVTDGPLGAFASDGSAPLWVPCAPDESPPVDRTGAGDAFSATCVAALARGAGLAEALRLAPINARSVVHAVGSQAGLLGEKELHRLAELEALRAGIAGA